MPEFRSSHPKLGDEPPIAIHRGLTAEDYFTLGETPQPQNLVDGLLYVAPQPPEAHEDAVLAIAQALAGYGRTQGGKVFVGRDCWLGEATVVQPDVAYLAPERAHLAGRYLRGAPDLVVEVVSAGTVLFDREAKFAAYAASDVREAWWVDLGEQSVTVFAAGGEHWQSAAPVPFGYAIPSGVAPGIGAAGLDSVGD